MPGFKPGAGEPDRETVLVMIAAAADHVGGRLGERGATKLRCEQDERIVKQPPPRRSRSKPATGRSIRKASCPWLAFISSCPSQLRPGEPNVPPDKS